MDRPNFPVAGQTPSGPSPLFNTGYDALDWIDMVAFRHNSRQLWEFVEGDHHSLADELRAAMPNQEGLDIRPVPICERYADEVATLYHDDVYRQFSGFTDAQLAKVQGIYANSGITEFLHKVQRHLALQRTVIIAVVPDAIDRVSLMFFCVYEAQVDTAGGPDVADITRARGVLLRWPLGSVDDQVTLFGYAYLTQQTAYILGSGVKTPLYNADPADLSNPFGRIPLITARLGEAKKGRFWSPLNDTLLAQEIAASLAESDAEIVLRHQGHGQKVITAGTEPITQVMVDKLPTGPNRILTLQSPNSDYKIVQGQIPVEQHIKLQDARLKNVAILSGISPNKFMRANTAQTQLSRDADKLDRQERDRMYRREFERVENEILKLVCEFSNMYGDPIPLPIPDGKNGVSVDVRYPEYEPPADALRSAQADAILDQTGEDSVIERVAARENVSRTLAEGIVKRRLTKLIELDAVRGRPAPMAGPTLEKSSLAAAPGVEDGGAGVIDPAKVVEPGRAGG